MSFGVFTNPASIFDDIGKLLSSILNPGPDAAQQPTTQSPFPGVQAVQQQLAQPQSQPALLGNQAAAKSQTYDDFQAFADAIMSQESGGNYGAVNSSSGALGAYQIMPANIASWSMEALGFSITPDEFLASPHYQDIIALHKLRGYYDKYGARGAAAAWYSGDPSLADDYGSQNGGPSIGSYVDSIVGKMGGGATNMAGSGIGGGSGGAANSYQVDGHSIVQGSADDVAYQMANSLWKSIYMTNAPYSIIGIIKANHVTDKAQLETILNQMPSHIPGWNIGQYDSVKQAAQKQSDKYFGRPIPDSLMKEFAQKGIDSPLSVEAWFFQHGAKDMPKEDYQQIFDAALPYSHGIVGDVPHPSQIHHFYKSAQSRPTTTTPAPDQAYVTGQNRRDK